MNERIRELAERAGLLPKTIGPVVETRHMKKKEQDLEKFAMLVIQDYENDVRESRREVKSKLGYSRIGRNNV